MKNWLLRWTVCIWRSHRIVRSKTSIVKGEPGRLILMHYCSTLTARCTRCGVEKVERRWAFMKEAGALDYIWGGSVDNPGFCEHRMYF